MNKHLKLLLIDFYFLMKSISKIIITAEGKN